MKTLITILLALIPFTSHAQFQFVSDIHAGGNKIRYGNLNSILYPQKASGVFNSFLKNHKGETVITLGDLTNKDENKYYQKLLYYQKKNKADVIWVLGNHDGAKKFKKNFKISRTYYYTDRGDTRIIVLDSTTKFWNGQGWVDKEQLDWLKTVLTDKSIIAMHHPFIYNGVKTEWADRFLDVIGDTPVYAGHLHCYGDYGQLHIVGALTDKYRPCPY